MTFASSDGVRTFPLARGPLLELPGGITASGHDRGVLQLPAGATHFGLVVHGPIALSIGDDHLRIGGATHFVAPEPVRLEGGAALIISVAGYTGLRQLGGPLEPRGRLRYIDGCSDTLLVCPPRLGEPCLNHLHIPAGTDQSPHHHQTDRLGVIVRGRGLCRTASGELPLEPGIAWRIPPGVVHAFVTRDEALDVLAWHPDSTFGPRDEEHPMITRTVIEALRATDRK